MADTDSNSDGGSGGRHGARSTSAASSSASSASPARVDPLGAPLVWLHRRPADGGRAAHAQRMASLTPDQAAAVRTIEARTDRALAEGELAPKRQQTTTTTSGATATQTTRAMAFAMLALVLVCLLGASTGASVYVQGRSVSASRPSPVRAASTFPSVVKVAPTTPMPPMGEAKASSSAAVAPLKQASPTSVARVVDAKSTPAFDATLDWVSVMACCVDKTDRYHTSRFDGRRLVDCGGPTRTICQRVSSQMIDYLRRADVLPSVRAPPQAKGRLVELDATVPTQVQQAMRKVAAAAKARVAARSKMMTPVSKIQQSRLVRRCDGGGRAGGVVGCRVAPGAVEWRR